MVTLPADALAPFDRFTRYNSPYPAHDAGTAVDLYPGTEVAPSPVGGTVVRTRSVACPSKPYAADHDHLIVVDTGEFLARLLHVFPAVEPGDEVAVGDPLGELVRSGYFAPWVDNHVHLGFRERDQNAVRATGSLPLSLDVPLEAVHWDGRGSVVETGDTYVILDAPAHPHPGEVYAGIADDAGRYVLDGGIPHYDWGGRLDPDPAVRARRAERATTAGESPPDATTDGGERADADVRFLGATVGRAGSEPVRWADPTVLANDDPVMGLSLFLGREDLYAKLVEPGHGFRVGDDVVVTVEA